MIECKTTDFQNMEETTNPTPQQLHRCNSNAHPCTNSGEFKLTTITQQFMHKNEVIREPLFNTTDEFF